MAFAKSPFPVPVSPSNSTVPSVGATVRISSNAGNNARDKARPWARIGRIGKY